MGKKSFLLEARQLKPDAKPYLLIPEKIGAEQVL